MSMCMIDINFKIFNRILTEQKVGDDTNAFCRGQTGYNCLFMASMIMSIEVEKNHANEANKQATERKQHNERHFIAPCWQIGIRALSLFTHSDIDHLIALFLSNF